MKYFQVKNLLRRQQMLFIPNNKHNVTNVKLLLLPFSLNLSKIHVEKGEKCRKILQDSKWKVEMVG